MTQSARERPDRSSIDGTVSSFDELSDISSAAAQCNKLVHCLAISPTETVRALKRNRNKTVSKQFRNYSETVLFGFRFNVRTVFSVCWSQAWSTSKHSANSNSDNSGRFPTTQLRGPQGLLALGFRQPAEMA